MLKLKIINKPKMIKMKCNIEFPDVILANLQEKEVTPTKEQQEIVPDKNYDGLSKVIVDKIPDEYIIPTGNIEIIENGIYNVREKETANVNIPVLKLGTKNITSNGVYKASDDELDGYSEVIVGIKSLFTGHYDRQGLKQIGWTDEEIEYYQQNGVQWNESEDNYFKLNQTELAGDESSDTRFLPKNTTKNKFNGYYRLLAIPLLNTTSLTNMGSMFYYCYSLTTIPLLDTSNVTNMNYMFYNCFSLKTIPQLETSKVTSMGNMFYNCFSLKTIPQLETSKVTSMGNMFSNCSSLTTIPQLETSKVINMGYMFNGCYSLKTIPLLDTSSATNMSYMFNSCYSLKTIPLLHTSKVTDMNYMFSGCYSLATIPLLDTSNATNMGSMFQYCYSLTTIPQLETSKVTNMSYMFSNCTSLTDFGGLENLGQAYDTSKSANYSYYKLDLSACTKLTEQSLINVLNNLYDIKTKGCKAQQVVLGSTNLAKLTSTEGQQALSNAQAKGWTVS